MQLKWPMRWDLFSLFPAYAGVIPKALFNFFRCVAFPRIRGGDPYGGLYKHDESDFSPHTRG